MKRKYKAMIGSLFLCIALATLSISAYTGKKTVPKSKTIQFEGKTYSVSELSSKTLEWIKWFEDLPQDSQEMVNYRPADLQK